MHKRRRAAGHFSTPLNACSIPIPDKSTIPYPLLTLPVPRLKSPGSFLGRLLALRDERRASRKHAKFRRPRRWEGLGTGLLIVLGARGMENVVPEIEPV